MKLLTVTYKRCYRVNGKHYTTGGAPKEFNTLAQSLDFFLLAEILDRNKAQPSWEEIDPRAHCFSVGKVIEFSSFPPPVVAIVRAARLARRIVRDHKIDVVLLKGPSEISLAPLLTVRKLGVPMIYHYSLDWIQDVVVSSQKTLLRRMLFAYFWFVKLYRRAVLRIMLPRADALATVATPYAKKLEAYKPGRVHLMPSTFTTARAQIVVDLPEKDIARHHLLFVGRIDRNKNLELIAEALALLNKSRPVPKVVVDVIGEGEHYAEVLRLAGALGVAGQFHAVGYVRNDDLQQHYAAAFALILPSFSELLPKVVIESFTAGTPVIAARVGGIPDMLEDGVNGFFIDPFSPKSLAHAIERMIDDPAAYRAMQAGAAKTAQRFTRESTLARWTDTLNRLVSEKK